MNAGRAVGFAVVAGVVAAVADLRGATPNTWLGKSADWADRANWSSGAAPSGGSTQDVSSPAGKTASIPCWAPMPPPAAHWSSGNTRGFL